MIGEERTGLTIIDTLIQQNKPFAIYRIPGKREAALLVADDSGVRVLHDLSELNGRRGFVIAPFHSSDSCPIVLIEPEAPHISIPIEMDEGECGTEDHPFTIDSLSSPCDKNYKAHFELFIDALHSGVFDKLVLSRCLVEDKKEEFSLTTLFRTACGLYIHSYIYLCYTPQTGIWFGSTPEVILSGNRDEWRTVALAGTQPLQNGHLPESWDDKNRAEQEYVASYIRSQLLSFGIQAAENGPYSAYAGALSHLKTDFRFQLTDGGKLGDLLRLLHPTPAVCGLPKGEAYRFILYNEGYDRRYYSGFIGWIDPAGATDLFVNLRCMNIDKKKLTLYAGGGLLASSDLNDEWQETEKKLQTMKRILSPTSWHMRNTQ